MKIVTRTVDEIRDLLDEIIQNVSDAEAIALAGSNGTGIFAKTSGEEQVVAYMLARAMGATRLLLTAASSSLLVRPLTGAERPIREASSALAILSGLDAAWKALGEQEGSDND